MKHPIVVARVFLTLAVFLTAVPTHASLSGDVHALLAHERFDEAASAIQMARDRARGDTPADKQVRLTALNLLLDMAAIRNVDEYPGAQQWLEDDLALERELHGADSRGLAKALAYTAIRNLHEQHFRVGQEQIKQATSLVEHGKGKLDELDRAYVLSIAASFAELHGQISQAESLAEQSVKILSPLHGDWQRVAYLHVLVKLSGYQVKNGKENAALATAQTGVTLSAQVVGPQSLMHTLYVMTVGDVMLVHGDYVGGRDALQNAIAALRQRTDARGLLVYALDALADCNRGLGDPDAARSLYREALDLVRKNTGQKARIGINVQMALLADLDREIGRYDDARALFEQIVAQEDSVPGSEQNPHLYAPLANLGALALRSGNVDAAEKYYTRAQAVLAATVGEEHGYSPENTAALGEVALARGDPAEAERRLQAAEDLLAKSFGRKSPPYLQIHCELALAQARQNKTASAFEAAVEVETQRALLLNRLLPALGEGQALRFKHALDSCDGELLALAAGRNDGALSKQAWNLVASTRGLATRLQIARLAIARKSTSPSVQAHLAEWEHAVQIYANALVRGGTPDAEDSESLEKDYQRVDAAEAALGSTLGQLSMGAGNTAAKGNVDSWLAALGDDAVMIAYVKASTIDLGSRATTLTADQEHLYAFVATPQTPPRLIDLGKSDELEAIGNRWYSLLRRPDSRADELKEAGLAVRRRFWDVLALDKPERVFMVPDSIVYRLNFAALPDANGYLIEKGWRFHTFETESDAILATPAAQQTRLLLVGNLDFGKSQTASTRRSGEKCTNADAQLFAPLPGAAQEMKQLALLWKGAGDRQVTELSGRHVVEAIVRRDAPQADIIHFATHGFELGADCGGMSGERGVSLREESDSASIGATRRSKHEAALALSNANADLASGETAGLLTSEQVVSYSLANVGWVILAACETGLGDVIGDEGVFGLRRAFRLAGAHTVVMSLWSVDDAATTGWMLALYKARLQHRDTMDATSRAELETIAFRRAQKLPDHPYYWAGFVAAGNWH